MGIKEDIEKIAKQKETEVGHTEENVKQKIIVPLLELLGHKKGDMEFEYSTSGGRRLDILIKNVPTDCKVIIDTKKYNEDLNAHIEQIKEYTFSESSLLTVIANGVEIRIYSPLRGVEFKRSLLYSIKRQDLCVESTWKTISGLLGYDNLCNRNALKKIDEREREIRDTMVKEDGLREKYNDKVEGIDSDIETKEDEIGQLRQERESLRKEMDKQILEIWHHLGLPSDISSVVPPGGDGLFPPSGRKARKVFLHEVVDAGLVSNGQTLYFFHNQVYSNEQAEIVASQNKLKYKGDNKLYSISDLAYKIDRKLGLKHDEHGVAGPKYWKTEDGRLLHGLNEQIRQQE